MESKSDGSLDSVLTRFFAGLPSPFLYSKRTHQPDNTLQFAGDLGETIRNSAVRPECPVTSDILNASVDDMAPEVVKVEAEGELALQLDRYREIREIVRKNVYGRIQGKRHTVDQDWTELL